MVLCLDWPDLKGWILATATYLGLRLDHLWGYTIWKHCGSKQTNCQLLIKNHFVGWIHLRFLNFAQTTYQLWKEIYSKNYTAWKESISETIIFLWFWMGHSKGWVTLSMYPCKTTTYPSLMLGHSLGSKRSPLCGSKRIKYQSWRIKHLPHWCGLNICTSITTEFQWLRFLHLLVCSTFWL